MARKLVHFQPSPRYTKAPEKCSVKYCRNNRVKHKSMCSKHRSAQYKERHPLRYYYNLLRCGARRRKLEFTLTFEYYEKMAIESGLCNRRGRAATSLSIDRIDSSRGYSDDNVRVCTISENSSKQNYSSWTPWLLENVADTDDCNDVSYVSQSGDPF